MTARRAITHEAPLLAGPTIASQRWRDVTFLHWRVASSDVESLLPPGIEPDESGGTSWVGLIAFRLDRATLLGSPPVPYLGDFVEINVRLYGVDFWGHRGVVFRSIEASRLAAVAVARAAFGVPCFWSRTRMQREGRAFGYDSARVGGGPSSMIRSRMGAPIRSGPLADFLTARWGLFTLRRHTTVWFPNVHAPWQLHAGELLDLDDQLIAAAGLPGIADRRPDSVLYSPGVTTRFGRALRLEEIP